MYEKKKRLLVMRHAKSDRSEAIVNDFDRPLNQRGQHQPEIIAKELNRLRITVDKVLVSPAKRTRETWNLLGSHLAKAPEAIFVPELYNAYSQDFIDVLIDQAQTAGSLLVIAHCPAVAEVTEFFTGEYHDFKTASLAILSTKKDRPLSLCLSEPRLFLFEEMLSAAED